MKKENNPIKSPSYRIAHSRNFPVDFRDTLKEKNIIYLVSVGTEKFEKNGVDRFVNFTKEIKPKKVLIVVADSLQRFNIEIEKNLSETEALLESKNRGKDWVEKYRPRFSTLEINHEFIFWEELRENKDYQTYFNEIMVWNESDDFKQLILRSAEAYISRFDRTLHGSRAIEQSSKFLNEECAILRILAKDVNTIGIFYPGPPLKIFNYIIDYANKSRSQDPFFYTELNSTKIKNKKQKDSKLNLFSELPFFTCRNLSIESDKSKNECFPPPQPRL